jgi:hypothetical protein
LRQINKYAFSGGGATVEEHRAKGANLDVDVPWKYLNFFMEDDNKLAHIGREYGAGRMLTGGCLPAGVVAHVEHAAASGWPNTSCITGVLMLTTHRLRRWSAAGSPLSGCVLI